MKLLCAFLATLCLAAGLWAQTTPVQAPTPVPAPPQSIPMAHPMPHDMMAMRQQHMRAMKAQLDQMRAKLDALKANLANVKDPAVKQQLQLDTDLWEMMVGHMESMQRMMQQQRVPIGMMPGPAMDMHHGDMEGCCPCCAGMKGGMAGGMKCMQGEKHDMTDKPAPAPEKQ